jgi:hypothetical protein
VLSLNRRQFVAATAALFAAPRIALADASWTFRATSGRRIVGILATADPDGHEAALVALRAASGYTRPLLYSSTDRLKLPFALAAIDHVATAQDLHFTVEAAATAPRTPTDGGYPQLEQLAAFLTGCAYGAVAGATHPMKRQLIAALRAQTSVLV